MGNALSGGGEDPHHLKNDDQQKQADKAREFIAKVAFVDNANPPTVINDKELPTTPTNNKCVVVPGTSTAAAVLVGQEEEKKTNSCSNGSSSSSSNKDSQKDEPPPPQLNNHGVAAGAAAAVTDQQNDENNNNNNNNNNEETTAQKQDQDGVIKKSPSLLDLLFGNNPNDDNEVKKANTAPPKPRPPKHLLWGCKTPEDHYAYIRQVCEEYDAVIQQDEEWSPADKLDILGFCYRRVHDPHSVCTSCRHNDATQEDSAAVVVEDNDDTSSFQSEDNVENNDDDGYYLDDDDDDYGYSQMEEISVPIGVPLEKALLSSPNNNFLPVDGDDDEDDDEKKKDDDTAAANKMLPRNTSAVSLFSLATHCTTESISSQEEEPGVPSSFTTTTWSDQQQPPGDDPNDNNNHSPFNSTCLHCASMSSLRLHHIASGYTLITHDNHERFIAPGKMYDIVADVCQEYAQTVLMDEGRLQWIPIDDDHKMDDHSDEIDQPKEEEKKKAGVLVSSDNPEPAESTSDTKENRPQGRKKKACLLVITGKGEVRAGMFSRRLLMTMGMEAATALTMIAEAKKRSMETILLDPNAIGWQHGMKVVEQSLDYLFLQRNMVQDFEQVFVLAHSMAGSQLVRFLQNRTNDKSLDDKTASWSFFRKIKAVAFTDSNHNINWVKTNPPLSDFLSGSRCVYIKSHKVHDDAKELGERHHDCHFWKHRFGSIRTLWAGTHEHALTNYIARFQIWEHFDAFLEQEDDVEKEDECPATD